MDFDFRELPIRTDSCSSGGEGTIKRQKKGLLSTPIGVELEERALGTEISRATTKGHLLHFFTHKRARSASKWTPRKKEVGDDQGCLLQRHIGRCPFNIFARPLPWLIALRQRWAGWTEHHQEVMLTQRSPWIFKLGDDIMGIGDRRREGLTKATAQKSPKEVLARGGCGEGGKERGGQGAGGR